MDIYDSTVDELMPDAPESLRRSIAAGYRQRQEVKATSVKHARPRSRIPPPGRGSEVRIPKRVGTSLPRKRGGYARLKIKTLMVLAAHESFGITVPAPTRALAVIAGIPIRSLMTRLPALEDQGLVSLSKVDDLYGPTVAASLGHRGKRYLQICESRLPNYGVFLSQLTAWNRHIRAENGALLSELMKSQFREFAPRLQAEVKAVNSQFSEWV